MMSTIVLLTINLVPHHHHEAIPCFLMELCEQDCSCNEVSTYEHTDDGHENERKDDTCIVETKYIVSSNNNEVKPRVLNVKDIFHSNVPFFPICFFVSNFFNLTLEGVSFKIKYGEYFVFYKSITTSQWHGLRAPPSPFFN